MLDQIVDKVTDSEWLRPVAINVALLIVVVLLRWVLARNLLRSNIKSIELRRRWLVQIRNLCLAIFVLGTITIWASELRTFAISIAAVLVAMVLATKELILCVTGSFLKITIGSFAVGDRIEINGIRGEVIDQTLLATKIMEIGPGLLTNQFTGRTVTVPNALFLSSSVFNETIIEDYVIHVMSFPVKTSEECMLLARKLEDIAQDVCRDHLESAKRDLGRLAEKEGLDAPSADPRVSMEFPEPDRVNLLLRLAIPSDRKGVTEREIRYRFFEVRQETATVQS